MDPMGHDFGKNNLHHIINTKLGDLVEWFPTKISDKKEGKNRGIGILGGGGWFPCIFS